MQHEGGQYVTVKVEVDGKVEYRPLTICNSPGRAYYRITVRPPGKVSTYLAALEAGAKLDLLAPTGKFTL